MSKKFNSKLVRKPELDQDDSSWLMSYADLMALLLGFFIILFAISDVDTEKYEQMYQSISQEVGSNNPGYAQTDNTHYSQTLYKNLLRDVQSFIQERSLENKVHAIKTPRGVEITASGSLLFNSGSAELGPTAKAFLKDLSSLFKKNKYSIAVEGHSDDLPIKSIKYPSNWELAAARSSSVVRYLIKNKVEPNKLVALSYSHTKPLQELSDKSSENKSIRAKNRRVVIVISKSIKDYNIMPMSDYQKYQWIE